MNYYHLVLFSKDSKGKVFEDSENLSIWEPINPHIFFYKEWDI